MSGKSTLIRSVAATTLLASTGFMFPALGTVNKGLANHTKPYYHLAYSIKNTEYGQKIISNNTVGL